MKISSAESDLVGGWRMVGRVLEADETAQRIQRLIEKHLLHLGSDASGWDALYRDPDDGRLWELTYPASDSEGGGPPRLTCIAAAAARRKYGSAVDVP